MKDCMTVITCDICNAEHVLRVPVNESVHVYIRGKINYPVQYCQLIGGVWRIVCKKCKEKDIAMRKRHEQERKEFTG